MSIIRKAITISEDDWAITLLKPFSGQYQNHLFIINEDAYGDAIMTIEQIDDLQFKLNLSDVEFQGILNSL